MTIHEIENLPAADLKTYRKNLVEAAAQLPVAELAERYVQARTDAKLRDEKLAEQGETITQLNAGLRAETGRVDALRAELDKALSHCAAVQQQYEAIVPERQALKDALRLEQKRSARLRNEALANHSAMNSAAQVLNDAIARQRVEQAAELPEQTVAQTVSG